MAEEKTLLVTGATGLVMSHLVKAWLEASPGHHAVAVDLNPPDKVVKAFFHPVAERLTFKCGDIRAPGLWQEFEREFAITNAVHGATVTSINRMTLGATGEADLTGALPALDTNMMGTAQALAWATRQKELKRFITVSSGSVYGEEGPSPLPEDGYVEVEGFYPITKYLGEMLTRQCATQFGLDAVSVRLSGVYGPLDRDTGARAVTPVPFTLLRSALDGREVTVSGLEAVGDYIHAGDVGDALVALLSAPQLRHDCYNIALGETWTLHQLLELTSELVPTFHWREAEAESAMLASDPSLTGGRWGAYDISRLREDCGWQPRPLPETFRAYLDWLTRHPY